MNASPWRRAALILASLMLAACAGGAWQRTDSGYWIARDSAPPPPAWSSTCFGAGFTGPWWPGHWRTGGFGHFGSCWQSAYRGSPHWFLAYGPHHYRGYPGRPHHANHLGSGSPARLHARQLGRSTLDSFGAGTPRYESLAPARGRDLGGSRIGGQASARSMPMSAPRAAAAPRAGAMDRRQEE